MSCYYNASATKFLEDSMELDMNEFYEAFLKRLPKTAIILDAGCGMGTDSLYFKNLGHYVIPMETSAEICRLAGENIGQSVLFCRFQDMHSKVRFDGIWACASLIHIPSQELSHIVRRFNWYLKDGGAVYASFGYGDFEGERDGQYYINLTEDKAISLFTEAGLQIEKIWVTEDTRVNHRGEKYLNIIATK
ncbi:MAG: class I SAM-dependent methyltransferase [Cellulosilyticum sp.]|nr:class I SAM-dependent methyltransferase [Cellulosilyticum sp.]